ncbi:MAG TPA: polymer-forming cytoskeletal protein [Methylomirabilota bacterium]|nr:polymer-forming cytoskeletal protein [Methylomirabilota bacterium]
MFRRGRKPHQRGGLTSFVDEGSEIEGKCTFSGTVMLNGKFKGEIATNETLIVGEKAVINADIHAAQVLISGEVVGTVQATERVELKRTARLFGDVEAPIIVVEEGVLFEGHCRMTKVNQIAEVPSARDLSVVALKR